MTGPVLDLGSFDSPLLICGGAYSNLEALSALFAEAERLGIPASRIIHTGDVIAYGPDPEACARLLHESGAHAIQGNVEEQLAAHAGDCACGYDEDTTCGALALTWYDFASRHTSEAMRAWMGTLPHQLLFRLGGRSFRVIHGSVNVINRFIYRTDPVETFAEELALAGCDGMICGHSGIPFTRHIGAKVWHNSGALGLPANDGTPRVWYSLVSPLAGGGVCLQHIPLAYDHLSAQHKMRDRRLPEPYAASLSSGLLPEGNALPALEQADAGIALRFAPIDWRPVRDEEKREPAFLTDPALT